MKTTTDGKAGPVTGAGVRGVDVSVTFAWLAVAACEAHDTVWGHCTVGGSYYREHNPNQLVRAKGFR